MASKNEQKIKKFYDVVAKIQPASGKEIGLAIVKKETLADISALAPNSNLVTSFDLNKDISVEETIQELYETMKNKRVALMRLYEWLDPQIYNQLHLITKDGRMQFARINDWLTLNVPQEAGIILISTDKELEKLNYKNIFDLVGPVLRLE